MRCASAPRCRRKCPPHAMIMAAGLGKRMRPLTATRPKPLIEVGGKALLDHVLEKLRAAGVRKVVVNVHYLADALEAHSMSRDHGLEVVISDEREHADGNRRWAGQGGAADRLRSVPRTQQRQSLDRRAGRHAEAARVAVGRFEDGRPAAPRAAGAGAGSQAAWATSTWTGRAACAAASAAMSRRSSSPASRSSRSGCCATRRTGPFSTNILWDRAIEEGRCFGAVHQGLWFDVGTPQSIPHDGSGAARMSDRGSGSARSITIPRTARSPTALAAGLIARFGKEPLGLARAGSCFPTTAPCARSPRRSCARAGAGLLLPRLIPIGDPELDERIGGALDRIDG